MPGPGNECPLWVKSSHWADRERMTAFDPKRTFGFLAMGRNSSAGEIFVARGSAKLRPAFSAPIFDKTGISRVRFKAFRLTHRGVGGYPETNHQIGRRETCR